MDRTPHRTRPPAPPVLELLEPPRGRGFDLVELEELILAVDDRIEYGAAAPESRAILRDIRNDLTLELGRLVAAL